MKVQLHYRFLRNLKWRFDLNMPHLYIAFVNILYSTRPFIYVDLIKLLLLILILILLLLLLLL